MQEGMEGESIDELEDIAAAGHHHHISPSSPAATTPPALKKHLCHRPHFAES
jgi:hypothetical protein